MFAGSKKRQAGRGRNIFRKILKKGKNISVKYPNHCQAGWTTLAWRDVELRRRSGLLASFLLR